MGSCLRCGVDYGTGKVNQKYCSEKCRRSVLEKSYRSRSKEEIKKKERIGNCVRCGEEFRTNVKDRKYCSPSCRWHSHKDGKRTYVSLKNSCESCGINDVRVIHRHHINPKVGNSGGIMFLCANCHLIYHKSFDNKNSTSLTREDILKVLYVQTIRGRGLE